MPDEFNPDDPPGAVWSGAVESPSISELADKAERAWRDLLVADSQVLQPDGCCSSDFWRRAGGQGQLCPYHQGYADGIDAVLERMQAIKEMTSGR